MLLRARIVDDLFKLGRRDEPVGPFFDAGAEIVGFETVSGKLSIFADAVAEAGKTMLKRVIDMHMAEFGRSEEHTSELQSLMRTSSAVLLLKKNTYIPKNLK